MKNPIFNFSFYNPKPESSSIDSNLIIDKETLFLIDKTKNIINNYDNQKIKIKKKIEGIQQCHSVFFTIKSERKELIFNNTNTLNNNQNNRILDMSKYIKELKKELNIKNDLVDKQEKEITFLNNKLEKIMITMKNTEKEKYLKLKTENTDFKKKLEDMNIDLNRNDKKVLLLEKENEKLKKLFLDVVNEVNHIYDYIFSQSECSFSDQYLKVVHMFDYYFNEYVSSFSLRNDFKEDIL